MEKLENVPKIDYSRIENPIVEQMFRKYDEHFQQATSSNKSNIFNYSKGYSKGSHSAHSKGGSGGCYLTTACVNAMNLPDNCLELSVLRNFRDKILMSQQSGREAVKEYYRIAPEIIEVVEEQDDAQMIWQATYRDIRHAISLVLSGDFEGAFRHYKQMSLRLKEKYLD